MALLRAFSNNKLIDIILSVLSTQNAYYLEATLELAGNLLNLDEAFGKVMKKS